jgi:Ni2+-binding GTPase involved in maturation of urease and hydrogenase
MPVLPVPDSEVRCPVAVVGLPGSGKTTVMSDFIKRLLEKGEKEKDLIVFFHVVASSPQSFSVKNLLTRLCEFLKKRCDLSLEVPKTMAALRDRFPLDSDSLAFLVLASCSCLSLPLSSLYTL